MRFYVRWKTGLDLALVGAARERLTWGLARFADRIARVVLWREVRTEGGALAPHWVVRVELHDGRHVIVAHPDPGGELAAAVHAGERVSRAVARGLAQGSVT